MRTKKLRIALTGVVFISVVAAASFKDAFRPQIDTTDALEAVKVDSKVQTKNAPANPEDFKHWLLKYKGVSEAQKELVFGMTEANATKASEYFLVSCQKGEERGCFQLAIVKISQKDEDGLDILHDLAIQGKNKEVSLMSAKLLGAYILDFAPTNKSAVSQSIEAVMPHAVQGDAASQFLSAHLFYANGIYSEADNMLNQACNNPTAPKNIIDYCKNGASVEMVGENGPIDTAKNEPGTACGLR